MPSYYNPTTRRAVDASNVRTQSWFDPSYGDRTYYVDNEGSTVNEGRPWDDWLVSQGFRGDLKSSSGRLNSYMDELASTYGLGENDFINALKSQGLAYDNSIQDNGIGAPGFGSNVNAPWWGEDAVLRTLGTGIEATKAGTPYANSWRNYWNQADETAGQNLIAKMAENQPEDNDWSDIGDILKGVGFVLGGGSLAGSLLGSGAANTAGLLSDLGAGYGGVGLNAVTGGSLATGVGDLYGGELAGNIAADVAGGTGNLATAAEAVGTGSGGATAAELAGAGDMAAGAATDAVTNTAANAVTNAGANAAADGVTNVVTDAAANAAANTAGGNQMFDWTDILNLGTDAAEAYAGDPLPWLNEVTNISPFQTPFDVSSVDAWDKSLGDLLRAQGITAPQGGLMQQLVDLGLPFDVASKMSPSNILRVVNAIRGGGGGGGNASRIARITSGQGGMEDWISLLGTVVGGAMDYNASSEQARALKEIADRSWNAGQPYRDRANAAMTPGFDIRSIPGLSSAMDTTTETYLRKLSATNGNPAGVGGAPSQTEAYVIGNVGLPAWQNYFNANSNAGGLSNLSAQSNQTATRAAQADAGTWGSLGNTVNKIFSNDDPYADIGRRFLSSFGFGGPRSLP